jgi:hypothetical protein
MIILAGACALFMLVNVADALAQGRGGGGGGGGRGGAPVNAGASVQGLGRADIAAGTHGTRGRAIARSRGSNAMGFCPPGQRKKPGAGSRFKC